jgi:carboxypeptidase PM20D1
MLKKVGLVILVLVVLLLLVLSINLLRFKAPTYAPPFVQATLKVDPTKLSKAIVFETISHKAEMLDTGAFNDFLVYLAEAFPLSDSLLHVKRINNYSLVYHWKGTSSDAPIVLAAHMDVVPVEYASRLEWEEAPFSGALTENHIYGRGTLDDKGSLIGILHAVELLLQKGYTPEQDIYLCFGHDEEIGGTDGAAAIVAYLKTQQIAPRLVLDEGGILSEGLVPGIDQKVALIGVSEKGYMSMDVEARIPGGHSSMPAQKTANNTLIAALHKLEENPLSPRISQPLEGFIQHIGPHLPFTQKLAFSNPWLFEPLIFDAYQQSPSSAALIQTTQTTTLLHAGIKDNVIPGRATATVNYRLLPGDTPEYILERAGDLIGDTTVHLSIHDDFVENASPVSPYNCAEFMYLQRCINTVYPDALVSPYLVLGATDGRYYYALTDKVYRFLPIKMRAEDLPRLHGINERIALSDFEQCVTFYYTFLQNLGALNNAS